MTRYGSRRGKDCDQSVMILDPFAVLIGPPKGVAKGVNVAGFNPLAELCDRSFVVIDPKGESAAIPRTRREMRS